MNFLIGKKGIILTLCSLIIISVFSFVSAIDLTGNGNNYDQPYCNNSADCSIDKGVEIVDKGINDIETTKKFSQKVQDIVSYMMIFVSILGVLYIIYAGFNIMSSSGDDGKVKKSKLTITHVIIGIILMWLAFPIIKWIIGVVDSVAYENLLYTKTYAYTSNDKNTFDEYKKKVEMLATDLERDYKVNSKISTSNLDRLKDIVTPSIDTFPDNDDFITNNNIAKNLLIAIDVVKKAPDSDSKINALATAISDYLKKIKIPRISATLKATPQQGNAPLNATLRASDVIDPSGVVIPQGNYVWWLKQSNGNRITLGTGPSINYTFKDEKNYLVNLDITSSSKNSKGKIDVLPYSGQIKLDVLPSIGNIYLYVNGINVSNLDTLKVTPGIGKSGLIIDASSSQASGGSKFIRTEWDFGNGNKTSYDLTPRLEKQYYANEGTYKLILNITTNEGKTVSKTLYIDVRDPVASIKTDKTQGFVGDDFKFGVNTAFLDGNLSYEWKVILLGENESQYTTNKENFSYQFKKTGKYTIKLKSTSPSGREDVDTVVINIDSRNPIATFDANQSSSETPNTYKFDASTSFDPDTFDSSKLQYSWIIDGQKVELDSPSRNGAIGKYTFDTEGTHKIVLEVSNQDGKTATAKKDLDVKSLLSVKINFSPKISKMGSSVVFIAESKESQVFQWNFGDGSSETTNDGRISHIYKKSGVYDLYLTVNGKRPGDTNSITRKVHVGDGTNPVASIKIKKENDEIYPSEGICDGQDAYVVDRSGPFAFSAEDSVNVDGTTENLTYSWKYMDKISTQKDFTFKFDELGCFPIKLMVKSNKNGKMDSITSLVKVDNLVPKVAGLNVTATDINSDPVVVKVTANNPKDADGVIVSYLWYYYTDTDPEPQDYRVTKSSSTTFVLPKVTGKYYFVLIMEDSNGAKFNTDKELQDKYSLELITDNINTPIIDLKADKTSISTGDEVNFEILVNDILGRDITDKVEYKFDFDGDGFYDETTKKNKISHKFLTPGNINFKVKVSYKGISNSKYQLISVKNTLKPNLEYYSIGSKLVLFNTSDGLYTSTTWDLGNSITSTNLDSLVYDFGDGDFPKSINLKVGDGQTSKSIDVSVKKDFVNEARLKRSKQRLVDFTYPVIEDSKVHLTAPGQKVFVYLGESKNNPSNYCIDTDLTIDTDLNGTADDDCDNKGTDSYTTGSPYVIKDFDKNQKEIKVRMSIYNGENILDKKDFTIVQDYIDAGANNVEIKDNKDISENDRKGIEELKDLIKKASAEKEKLQMMQYLSKLQENWFDDREKTKTIIDFESYINASSLSQDMKDKFYNILEGFLMNNSQAKDEVTLAAKVLKSLIPKTNPQYKKIMESIDEILSHPTNVQSNKTLGKFILDAIKDDANISNKDKVLIKSQLQVIIYGSQKDIPDDQKTTEDTSSSSSFIGFILGFIKVLGVLIGIIILLIFGLFIYFRVLNKNDNLSFQDFIVDLISGSGKKDNSFEKQSSKTNEIIEKPKTIKEIDKKEEAINNDTVNDIKENDESISKFDTNNIVSDNNSNTSNSLPDWLKGTSNEIPSTFETSTSSKSLSSEDTTQTSETIPEVQNQTQTDDSGLPDWLKGTSIDTPASSIESTFNTNESISEEKNETTSDIQTQTDDSGLPDWLKGTSNEIPSPFEAPTSPESLSSEDTTQTSETTPEVQSQTQTDDSGLPDWLKGTSNEIPSPFEAQTSPESLSSEDTTQTSETTLEVQSQTQTDDSGLPDWLKGTSNEIPSPFEAPTSPESLSSEDTTQTSETTPEVQSQTQTDDSGLPDWLKGTSIDTPASLIDATFNTNESIKTKADSDTTSYTKSKKNSEKNSDIGNKSPKKNTGAINNTDIKKPSSKPQKKEDKILNSNSDDLPDWLK